MIIQTERKCKTRNRNKIAEAEESENTAKTSKKNPRKDSSEIN